MVSWMLLPLAWSPGLPPSLEGLPLTPVHPAMLLMGRTREGVRQMAFGLVDHQCVDVSSTVFLLKVSVHSIKGRHLQMALLLQVS